MDVLLQQFEVGPMNNFIYFLGDPESKEVAVIDPAWDVPFILSKLERDGLSLTKILLTHGHEDHTNGLSDLLETYDVPVYLSENEAPFYTPKVSQLQRISHGDTLEIGAVTVDVIATPGHTPGGVCYRAGGHLITGDTLFVNGCGRVDLPGGDINVMYQSLAILKDLDDSLTVWPGHDYGDTVCDTLGNQKVTNSYLAAVDKTTFIRKRS